MNYVVGYFRGVELFVFDLVQRRVREVPLDQDVHGRVEGRRIEEPLAAGGSLVEDAPDRRQEAEIGHVVGLVDDGDLDSVEAAHAGANQILQPSRASDDDVDPRDATW